MARKLSFDIPLLDQRPLRAPAPFDDDEFDKLSCTIAREFRHRRQRDRGERRKAEALDWLTGVAYDVLKHVLDEDLEELIKERIKIHKRHRRGRVSPANPFQTGLMALFAHDKVLDEYACRPQDRERVGKRLWHAYRHFVPQPFVLGFIRQLDGDALLERAARNEIEPGFHDWIVERLVRGDVYGDSVRGAYPREIEDKVRLRASRRRSSRDNAWDDARESDDGC